MKKAGIFAVVLAVVVLFMQLYNYKLIGYMESDSYGAESQEVVQNLTAGDGDGKDLSLTMKRYEKSTAIFQRGKRLFAGENKEELDTKLPLYVNDGQAVLNMADSGELVDTGFEKVPVYEGLYVMDGMSFNRDRQQADPEEFILLSLENQVYLCAQTALIKSGFGETQIAENSIAYFDEDLVRYYSFEEGGKLSWHELTGLKDANISIGSMSCSWTEFIRKLKGTDDSEKTVRETTASAEETTTESAAETLPEIATEADRVTGAENTPGEDQTFRGQEITGEETLEAETSLEGMQASESTSQAEKTTAAELKDRSQETREKETTTARETTKDYSDDTHSKKHSSKKSDDEYGGNRATQASTQETATKATESVQTPSNAATSSNGTKVDPVYPFHLPEVTVEDFSTGVYHVSAKVSFSDPDGRLIKGIRLAIYKGNSLYVRKLVKENGTVTITPLEPDTQYYIEGYFDYYDQDGKKAQHIFLPKMKLPEKTKPLSYLKAIEVSQKWSGKRYVDQAEISGILLQDEETADPEKESAIPYIDTMICQMTKTGRSANDKTNVPIDSITLSALKNLESKDWISGEILDSNSTYEYELLFRDRFGNALVTKPEKVGGTLETSKRAPEADIRVSRDSSVEKTIITVKLENQDEAVFSDNTSLGAYNPYLTVAYVDEPDSPLPLKVTGEEEETRMVPVNRNGQTTIEITNLTAGRQYQIRVRGSYDILDGELHENEVLGTANYTTSRLNTLGTVNYNFVISDITYSTARISASLRNSINSVLEPYVNKMTFQIRKMDSKETPAYELTLDREKLMEIPLNGKETVIPAEAVTETVGADAGDKPFEAELKLIYPNAGAKISVWEAILNSGTLEVYFPDGNIGSATKYVAEMHAYASQALEGSSEEDVTGRYYSKTFQTLRQPAEAEVGKWFVTNNYVELIDLKINDPDGAVKNGNLSVRLIQNANNKVLDIKNTTVDEINGTGKLTFTNLKKDMEYRIEFYALEYNETYSSLNEVTFYRLPVRNGTESVSDSIRFTAGSSMWGSIEMLSIDSGYESGMYDASGENLFVINDASFSEISVDKESGTATIINSQSSNNQLLSGLIPVEAGAFYQLTGSGMSDAIYFFDADGSYMSSKSTGWNFPWRMIRIPDDVSYVRFYVNTTNLTTTCFMKIDLDLETAAARPENLVDSGEITRGYYFESDDRIIQHNQYSMTDYIPVEEGMMYVRMNCGSNCSRVNYYDENKNFVATSSWGNNTEWTDYTYRQIPEKRQIKYVRLMMRAGMEEKFYFAKVSDGSYGKNLFDDSMIAEQGYYYTATNVKAKNSTYCYSELIEVEPDAVYLADTTQGYIQFFDANRRFLGYVSRSGYYLFRTPAEAKYVRLNSYVSRIGSITDPISLRRIGPAQTQNQQLARFRVTVEDNESYLADAKEQMVQVLVQSSPLEGEENWTTENTITIPMTVENGKVKKLEKEISLALGGGKKYRTVLQAALTQYDHILELDEEQTETDKLRYLIRSEAGFASAYSDPFGEFIVTADFNTEFSNGQYFYGTIDFQGHQVTKEYTARGTSPYLINYLWKGALIENLNYNLTWHTGNQIVNSGGLVQYNYGTIQNLVAHLNVNNEAYNYNYAGLIWQNYASGRLENFAIVLDEDFVTSYGGAAGVKENYGIVRNGYLCTENDSRIIDYTPSGDPISKAYRAGIVSSNAVAGTVEQVYSLVTIENHTPATDTSRCGTVVGQNTGIFQNSFTVAHDLLDGKPYETSGPALGFNGGRMISKNIRYVQTTEYEKGVKGYYVNNYQSEAEVQALADKSWYDYSINLDGHFQTDMVPAGYYPRLDMPECISNQQPLLDLPTLVQPQLPTMVSANVVEQQADGNYLAEFSFINPQNLRITAIQLADRSGTSPNYIFTKALTCTIQSQQLDSDGVYRVRAILSDPTIFRSRYYVDYFEAKSQSAGANQIPYQVTDRTNSIYAAFYQEIATLNDWTKIKSDYYGNYRLVADLDFSRVPYSMLGSYLIDRNFYGSLDGAYQTADGETKNHRIYGFDSGSYGYMFTSVLDGTISNLDIVGFRADEKTESTRTGWIRSATRETLRNIHVMDSSITAGNNGGVLASQIDTCVVQDCSVTDSTVTSWEYLDSKLGGFAAYISNSIVENCFTSGIHIDAVNARASSESGIGGFVGGGTYSSFTNCYAQGSIETSIPDVGGFAGAANSYGSGTYQNIWTKVDISTATGNVGGLVGRATGMDVSGVLAAGDIISRSGEAANINRIMGTVVSGNLYFSQAGAYAGQFLGSGIQPELKTNEGVLATAADLRDWNFYDSQIGMDVGQFDMDGSMAGDGCGIEQGYLPRLLSTEGKVLPHQTPVSITATSMQLNVDTLQQNSNAANQFKEKFGDAVSYPAAWTSVYQMNFQVTGANGYRITDVSLGGINLNAYFKIAGEDQPTFTENIQSGQISRLYPFLQLEMPYDRYILNVTMTPEDRIGTDGKVTDHTGDVLLSTTVSPKDALMMTISNAKEWNEVMSKYKDSYGNFEIRGDIDASTLDPGESLITGVRVNRLVSYNSERKYVIKNVTIDTTERYESLIKESTSLISNLKFEDITVRYTKNTANQSIGVIGQNNGKIQNVEFERINIDAGLTTNAGCIGSSNGEITNVTLKDIQVSGEYNNVGGLVGFTTASLRDISASGTVGSDGSYSYRIEGKQHYVGGIAGGIQTSTDVVGSRLHVDTIKVVSVPKNPSSSYNNIGIGAGYGNIGTDLPTDPTQVTEDDYSTVTNSVLVKEGKGSSIAGMTGNGHAYYTKVTDCRIQGNSEVSNVGGITPNGSTFGSTSERNVIIGGNYTGGATGNSQWNSLSYTTVRNCIVQGGNYTGGMSGSGRIIKSQVVENTKVSGGSYVGGITGRMISGVDSDGRIVNSEITGTNYVGGILGVTDSTTTILDNLLVSGTKITASMDTETGNSYAGGIGGYLGRISMLRSCVVDENTTIDAAGNYVGGLAGYAKGGYHNHNYSAAKINCSQSDEEPMGNYVGGLYGGLGSSSKSADPTYRETYLSESYFAGTVRGNNYVGGLIGLFEAGDTDGAAASMTSDHYSSLLLAGDVESRVSDNTAMVRPDANIKDGTKPGKIDGFRIYDQSTWNGNSFSNTFSYPQIEEVQGSAVGKGSGSSAAADGAESVDFTQPMYVGASSLSTEEFYTRTRALGGMGWSRYVNTGYASGGWNFEGLMNMKAYPLNVNLAGSGELTLKSDDVSDGTHQVTVALSQYVEDGLKMHYDGIQNTRNGHSDDTRKWENLAGDPDYDLEAEGLTFRFGTDNKGNPTGDGWKANSYRNETTTGTPFSWKTDTSTGERWETMTMSATFSRTTLNWAGLIGFGNWDRKPSAGLQIGDNASKVRMDASGPYDFYNTDMMTSDDKVHNLTSVWNFQEKTQTLYLDGEQVYQRANLGDWTYDSASGRTGFGKAFRLMGVGSGSQDNDNVTSWNFRGNLYNAKVYDRALTETEIVQNYQADIARFGTDGTKGMIDADGNQEMIDRVIYQEDVKFSDGTALINLDSAALDGVRSGDIKVTVTESGEEADADSAVKGMLHSVPLSSEIVTCTVASGSDAARKTLVAEVRASGDTYQWYRSDIPGYNGVAVKGENADAAKAVLWGRGYYYCKVTSDSGTAYTPIIAVETNGYLPYVNRYGRRDILANQEGFYTESLEEPIKLKTETLASADAPYSLTEAPKFMQKNVTFYSTTMDSTTYKLTDTWFSGGAALKNDSKEYMTFAMFLMAQPEGNSDPEAIPELTVYPSGIDRINLEFDSKWSPEYYVIIKDASGNTLMQNMDQRVYTMGYDFKSELTVTIGNHIVSKSYKIDPTKLRRTVMTYGDRYYYLSENNVYSTELLAEGDYLHLYDGMALSSDGRILVLDDSQGEETAADELQMMQILETTPLYEFDYDGTKITTYEHFSVIDGDADGIPDAEPEENTDPGSDQAVSVDGTVDTGFDGFQGMRPVITEENADQRNPGTVRELKLVVKDGDLYALDTKESISGSFVTDTYQDQTWIMLAGEDGKVNNLADTMKWPSGIAKTGIAHTTNNLDCSEPWILIRYKSGYVKGFNYVTGEELALTNPKSDLSLIDYIGNFFNDKLSSLRQDDKQEYLELISLKKKLTVNPIDDSMLIDGDKVDGAGQETEETAFAKDGSDGALIGQKAENGAGTSEDGIQAKPGTGGTASGTMSESGTVSGETGNAEGETGDTAGGAGNVEGEAGDASGETGNVEGEAGDTAEENGNMEGEAGDAADTRNDQAASDKAPDEGTGTKTKSGTEESAADEEDGSTSEQTSESRSEQDGTAAESRSEADGETSDQAGGNDSRSSAEADGAANTAGKADVADSAAAADKSGKTGDSESQNSDRSAESGTSEQESARAKESADHAEPSGAASSEAQPAKRTKYTYVYNTEKKEYELYKTSELLDPDKDLIVSEQEKIRTLAARGVMVGADGEETQTAAANKQEKTGLIFFLIAGMSAIGLAGLIIYRKKRYE